MTRREWNKYQRDWRKKHAERAREINRNSMRRRRLETHPYKYEKRLLTATRLAKQLPRKKKLGRPKELEEVEQTLVNEELITFLSLKPFQMSMEDHYIKGYFLANRKKGMSWQEAYDLAKRQRKMAKRQHTFYW